MKNKMKKFLALLAALMMLSAVSLAAAETRITVSGTGETRISADTAVISMGVSARDKDVLKAQQTVNERIAKIRQALTGIGVAEENINTDYMSIYAIYDYADDVEKVQAYSASMTLAVKVADMEIVGKVIDEAFAAGANTLNGISFSASDTAAAEKESLQAAVADARAKAEILAEAAGLKITGIELVSDGNVYSYDNSVGNFSAKRMEGAAMDAGYGTMVQAAKLIVSASVSITFTAE